MMRGLLIEKEGVYALFSVSLEQWIMSEITALPGQEESQITTEEWLQAGGLEKLETEKLILPKFKKKYWHVIEMVSKELSMDLIGMSIFEVIKAIVMKGAL